MEKYDLLLKNHLSYDSTLKNAMTFYCQDNSSKWQQWMVWRRSFVNPTISYTFNHTERFLIWADLSRLNLLRPTVHPLDISNADFDNYRACQEVKHFCALVNYPNDLQCKQFFTPQ